MKGKTLIVRHLILLGEKTRKHLPVIVNIIIVIMITGIRGMP